MKNERENCVKLVHISPDIENLIVEMARVSNPANAKNKKTAPKLLKYLIKHKHWSPFEMGNMCYEVHTTRAVSAQMVRHRSLHFQEFSTRYADSTILGKADMPKLRMQDEANRQNSTDDCVEKIGEVEYEKLQRRLKVHYENTYDLYEDLLAFGVARECARDILPLNTPTKLYVSGTIRDFMFYLSVRSGHGTQMEHVKVANQMLDIFRKELPNIYDAFFCVFPEN